MHRLPALVLLAGACAAQDFVFPQGFASISGPPADNVPAARARDIDLDGVIQVPGELFPFLTTGFPDGNGLLFLRDAEIVVEDGEPAFYFADTETGDVIRGSDDDHDGVLDASEITEFFTFGRAQNGTGFLGSPSAVAAWRDPASNQTRVYASLQNSNPSFLGYAHGIHRLVDLNGDRDAKDPGEHSVFVDSTMGLTVPGNSGPVPINLDFWDTLTVLPGGKLIAWADGLTINGPPYVVQPAMNAFYGFTDNNGVAVPEVWLNVSALNDLPLHPDFANATFPAMDVQAQGGTERSNFVRFIDTAPPIAPGAPASYFIGSSYNDPLDLNPVGQRVSGLVYRVSDADNDQVIDPGELTLFANFSGTTYAGVAPITFTVLNGGPTISFLGPAERPWGMSASRDGSVSFLLSRGEGSVITMRDADFSGVIDQNEIAMEYMTGGGIGTYPFPFAMQLGPYWDGFVTMIDGLLPGPFPAGVTPIGDGCLAPTRGLVPVMDVWNGAPQVGNLAFELGPIRANLFSPVLMVADFALAPAPVPLQGLGLPAGCTGYLLNPVSVGFAFADGAGRGRFGLGLPNDPGLVGVTVLFQAAILDTGSAVALPFHTTNALQLVVQA